MQRRQLQFDDDLPYRLTLQRGRALHKEKYTMWDLTPKRYVMPLLQATVAIKAKTSIVQHSLSPELFLIDCQTPYFHHWFQVVKANNNMSPSFHHSAPSLVKSFMRFNN